MKITTSSGAFVNFLGICDPQMLKKKYYNKSCCLRVSACLPIMTPFGSTGGCQTTLTSDRRTSGNTSLMGGPGTETATQGGGEEGINYQYNINVTSLSY